MKNFVAIKAAFSGEYRYRLTGPDGKIKQECDWTPNLILDRGLEQLLHVNITSHMGLGDSDIPVANAQTGLQGSLLGSDLNINMLSRNTPIGPDWERSQLKEATFGTGIGTGTIKEFILTEDGTFTLANIRVVLTTPIVKGPLDELTIQHNIFFWPNLSDVDAVIDISGVAYNVKMRMFYGINNQNTMDSTTWDNTSHLAFADATLPADISVENITGSGKGNATAVYKTWGGVAPNFWSDLEVVYGIDQGIGTNINVFQLAMQNAQPRIAALVTKVSDGTGIDKPNTHELRLYWRVYTARYVP